MCPEVSFLHCLLSLRMACLIFFIFLRRIRRKSSLSPIGINTNYCACKCVCARACTRVRVCLLFMCTESIWFRSVQNKSVCIWRLRVALSHVIARYKIRPATSFLSSLIIKFDLSIIVLVECHYLPMFVSIAQIY